MNVPDYSLLIVDLLNLSGDTRLLASSAIGVKAAILMYKAADALQALTHIAEFYERKAETAIKFEPIKIIAEPLPLGEFEEKEKGAP